jgi:aryl-alcohol dehydrogenase-like predicted oxidoreductase
MDSWLHRTPRAFRGKRLFRLGLAADYGLDEAGVRLGMERGVNLFLVTMRGRGLRAPLKEALRTRRDQVAVVAYAHLGWFGWGVRRGAEQALRELGTDHLDVLLLAWLGVGSAWTAATERELVKLRESGKVRALGVSIHDRPRAGRLAAGSPLDLLMLRYNAAHPGAEEDVFPHRRGDHPTILAYTATSWRRLLRRPRGWTGPVMSAGDCYRFQLSSPHVDLALTAPRTREELAANLEALERGPLTEDETRWMRDFGRAVHA